MKNGSPFPGPTSPPSMENALLIDNASTMSTGWLRACRCAKVIATNDVATGEVATAASKLPPSWHRASTTLLFHRRQHPLLGTGSPPIESAGTLAGAAHLLAAVACICTSFDQINGIHANNVAYPLYFQIYFCLLLSRNSLHVQATQEAPTCFLFLHDSLDLNQTPRSTKDLENLDNLLGLRHGKIGNY